MELLAWIFDDVHDGTHIAMFVSAESVDMRAPARRCFTSREAAVRWIEEEAQDLACSVKWLCFESDERSG